jgi:hypothetical protein
MPCSGGSPASAKQGAKMRDNFNIKQMGRCEVISEIALSYISQVSLLISFPLIFGTDKKRQIERGNKNNQLV